MFLQLEQIFVNRTISSSCVQRISNSCWNWFLDSYPIYEENKKVFCGHIRVIQSSTWEIIVRCLNCIISQYEKEFRNATPNSAVWSPNGCSFSCCLTNGDIVSFSPMLSLIVCSLHLNMKSLSPDEFCSKWIFVMTRTQRLLIRGFQYHVRSVLPNHRQRWKNTFGVEREVELIVPMFQKRRNQEWIIQSCQSIKLQK